MYSHFKISPSALCGTTLRTLKKNINARFPHERGAPHVNARPDCVKSAQTA